MRFSASAVLAVVLLTAETTANPSIPCNGGTMYGEYFGYGPVCKPLAGGTSFDCGSATRVILEKGGKDLHLLAPSVDSTIQFMSGHDHVWDNPCPGAKIVVSSIFEDDAPP
ncbi:hypothetical protein E4U42_000491 [Claviceps africana]|uniref:Uncharacterized protein n=1 Tax=Claviceps africana TaxID=83212 RepID=A0A8K0NFI5_9HYPO|nr:hypothetical protein E4U42_000491 [Claviceps africana]